MNVNNMGNVLELKTVNQLQEFSFFIPGYQRGYKWSKKEITELLNDISDFVPRLIDDSDDKTWYCLQPIIVKGKNDNTYEIIDGQQRLTTIYLILYYLNQDFVESRRDKLFQLCYETRSDSGQYLSNLDENKVNKENIDYFYISNAYRIIAEWFDRKGANFDKGEFRTKLKFNSKVIWYLSAEIDSIAIFRRINIGKIPLTNAELIKALFLNSSNFSKNDNRLKLRQLEIATEWDNIESSLQDDKFWYFLSENKVTNNRIEFIFNLMHDAKDLTDHYSTFRFFVNKFEKKNQDALNNNWDEVKSYYRRFREWYEERDLYHKIGYLVSVGATDLKNLYVISDRIKKTEFRCHLDKIIKNDLKKIDLDDLQYSDLKNVRKIMLLYNILTMLNGSKDNSYFPFHLYKNEKWDIEHITSVKDKMPEKNRGEWLKDAKAYIETDKPEGKKLVSRIEKYNINNDSGFKSLFEDIVDHFNSHLKKDDDIDNISNLTLLDSETNRSYKNAVFPFKRKTIIDRDKQGVFIPVCTKNVFLKYFSKYPPKISFWTQEDRDNYEKDLYDVLEPYLD